MPNLPASVSESADQLPSLVVCNPHARARIYLHGAHLASFRPVGQGELLWTSVRSWFEPGRPIRGGIPVCFPWFGAHAGRADLPAHGFARLLPFSLRAAEDLPDGRTRVVLALGDSPETRASWPHPFAVTYTVTVGPSLEAALEVRNTGAAPFTFEEALHTYFDVGDVRRTTVGGLAGARYLDKVAGGEERRQGDEPVSFVAETDRLFPGHSGRCAIEDVVQRRRILVDKEGSRTTVVWNPWLAKAARMPDFGDHEWPGMVCVEAANTGDDRVTLAPGEAHRMTLTIGAAPLG